MSIATRLKDDMKTAMRDKDKGRLATIRLIMAQFKQHEVDEGEAVTDEIALSLLDKMIKQRRDSIKQFVDNDRPELAEQEQAEVAVIQGYLPEQLTPEAIEALLKETITSVGAESMKDMGKVMAVLKPKLQGRADLGVVSGQLKSLLS